MWLECLWAHYEGLSELSVKGRIKEIQKIQPVLTFVLIFTRFDMQKILKRLLGWAFCNHYASDRSNPTRFSYKRRGNESKGKRSPPLSNLNDTVWMTSADCCHHSNGNLPGNVTEKEVLGMLVNISMEKREITSCMSTIESLTLFFVCMSNITPNWWHRLI